MEEINIPKIDEYAVYIGDCPHCKVSLEVDYVIVPRVQKQRFTCPGCRKTVFISKEEDKDKKKKPGKDK